MNDPAFYSDGTRLRRQPDRALRAQSLRQSWPTLIMIPGLIAVLHACAFSVLINVFLGETFGLSNGHPAPWPGAIAVIFMLSFWINRFIGRWEKAGFVGQIATFVAWLGVWLAWMAIDPAYNDATIWSHPSQLVNTDAWLIPPLLISMAAWWSGLSYAGSIANISAEELRSVVQRDWIILFASILVGAMVGGAAGAAGLDAARIAVPLQLIVSVALIAGAENEGTRRMAHRRGGTVPGWGRWIRLVGGVAAAVLLVSVVVLALLSPEVLGAIVGALATVMRGIGWVMQYVLYAVVWVLFHFFELIIRIFNAIFGGVAAPIEPLEMPLGPPMQMEEVIRPNESGGGWKYAMLLRWAGLVLLVLIVAIVVFRLSRREAADDDDAIVDEQRDSVFSADLARKQLRDLFRRRHREAALPRLDLDRPPADLRETMVYLEVLAARQGESRRPAETPRDFAARLQEQWPGVHPPLAEFPDQYSRVRYGEVEQPTDIQTSASLWSQIWSVRKGVDSNQEKNRES